MPYNKIILSTHIFVPKTEIEDINAMRRRYTISSKYKDGPRIPYYLEDEFYFGIPRHAERLSKNMANEIIDKRVLGSPIDFKFSGELWDYQEKAVNTFNDLVGKGGTGFFLCAAPGSGKTVMGIKMLERLGVTSLIIVPKSDLVKQWRERITSFSTLTDQDIGVVEGGTASYIGKKVVIGLIHSVIIDRIASLPFCNYFGAVLFDECDSSLPPKTFSSASGMFPAKYRIGMTASATRADGLHIIFEEHLAQFKISCSNTKTLEPMVLLHKFKGSSGTIPPYLKDLSRRGVLISKLASNPVRNDLIANYANKSYNSGRPTLIISDRKSQLKSIEKLLIKTYNIKTSEIGYFVRTLDGRDLKQFEKDKTVNTSKIILATYGMLSRGTDIPRLETLILATPHSDLRQTAGRIERSIEGKNQPLIIDIVDSFYPETKRSAEARMRFYKKRELRIKEIR
jgi:superfamily II DNA or RNA helicase